MKIGDKVRIIAGKGKGHIGVIVKLAGRLATVRAATLGLGDGVGQEYAVSTGAIEPAPFAGATPARTAAAWREYKPAPFSALRPGSMRASELPSIMGGEIVSPRAAR